METNVVNINNAIKNIKSKLYIIGFFVTNS